MEDSLVNLFVRSEDRDAVAEAVMSILRPCYIKTNTASEMDGEETALYVAPSIRGWVGVFDLLMEDQSEALCEWTVRKLSGALNTVALSFLMHEEEYIRYWLAQGGRLVDRYHSLPDLSGPKATAELKRLQGRPSLLADLCGKPLEALSIARLMREPDWEGMGLQFLEDLGSHLGIPNLLFGFNGIDEADDSWLEGVEAFRAVSLRELLGA